MKRWAWRAAFAAAVITFALTLVNASWLASKPVGGIRLIAHRGVAQQFDRKGVDGSTCTAARIEPPVHNYLENSERSLAAAPQLGADMVELDIAPTADGRIAVFHDWSLDCRTNGKGDVRARTLAELQALDAGYGYTADGGKSFPLRGSGRERIPTLEQALAALPGTPILFNFKSKDPAEADLLAAALERSRRKVEVIGDAFYGAPAPVDRMRSHYPKAWSWSLEGAKRCSKDYLMTGWFGHVPESCRNGTLVVPLNYQWAFWGWPNRLIARMDSVGARVVVMGPYRKGEANGGIDLPEQLGDIPSTFKGYIWVEDIWTVGPALRPRRDIRTEAQQDAATRGLAARRARR